MSSAPDLACSAVSANTTAIASPTNLTLPCANNGCGGSLVAEPSLQGTTHPQIGPPTLSTAISSPVKTPTTPGADWAFFISIFFIFA